MSVDSFRDYLSLLDSRNALNRISQDVSWNLQASAVTMRVDQTDDAIPVFESVPNTAGTEARLVGDPYRGSRRRPWDRIGGALGLPTGMSGGKYYETIIDRLTELIPPEVVTPDAAPCKEVIQSGADVDLFELPWPYIHMGDGDRYSNLHTVITTDPSHRTTRCARRSASFSRLRRTRPVDRIRVRTRRSRCCSGLAHRYRSPHSGAQSSPSTAGGVRRSRVP